MARKSRTITEAIKQKFRVWRIAIYIRLSKEDARSFDESESVSNQRAIIEEHIASFNDGDEYIIVDEYVDDTAILGLKSELQRRSVSLVQVFYALKQRKSTENRRLRTRV